MKFTESPVVELEVQGTRLQFEQDNATMHVGTSVWPCSLVLVKFIERWKAQSSGPNPYSSLLHFTDKRAVELGSGCGVAAIILTEEEQASSQQKPPNYTGPTKPKSKPWGRSSISSIWLGTMGADKLFWEMAKEVFDVVRVPHRA